MIHDSCQQALAFSEKFLYLLIQVQDIWPKPELSCLHSACRILQLELNEAAGAQVQREGRLFVGHHLPAEPA